jgi:hypothetical protein
MHPAEANREEMPRKKRLTSGKPKIYNSRQYLKHFKALLTFLPRENALGSRKTRAARIPFAWE